jgi:hypothetical protein
MWPDRELVLGQRVPGPALMCTALKSRLMDLAASVAATLATCQANVEQCFLLGPRNFQRTIHRPYRLCWSQNKLPAPRTRPSVASGETFCPQELVVSWTASRRAQALARRSSSTGGFREVQRGLSRRGWWEWLLSRGSEPRCSPTHRAPRPWTYPIRARWLAGVKQCPITDG